MKKISLMLGAVAIAGCATQSSQLTKLGESTYRVTVHAVSFRNREVNAFQRAQTEASALCATDHMTPHVIKTEAGPAAGLPEDTVVLTFRCVSERDPAIYQSMPLDSDRA